VGIEGLRGLAALTILFYHVWLYGAPGAVEAPLGPSVKVLAHLSTSVTLFFVLSGFLLFRPYAAAALRDQATPRTRQYFLNRALRILPAYWFSLLIVALLFERQLIRDPLALLANAAFVHFYIPSYYPFNLGTSNGMFGIVATWSLAVEVIFYLCVPLLGWMAISLARSRRLPTAGAAFVPVAVMIAIGLVSKGGAHAMGGTTRRLWEEAFPIHADWFAAGMAIAVLRILWEDGRIRTPRRWTAVALVSALAFSALGAHLRNSGALTDVEYQTPMAVACAFVLAIVVLPPRPDTRILRFLDSRAMVWFGLWSYSIFLWHDPILRAMRSGGLTLPGAGGFVVNLLVVFVLTVAISAFAYRYVERPALALKRVWHGSERAPGAVDAFGTVSPAEVARRPRASAVAFSLEPRSPSP
jgi:peptidoglycan/LPS O-acetylase OafA/YrhL